MRFYGYDFDVSVLAYYKVAMAKRTKKDDIEEEGFDAVKNLYKNEPKINVINIELDEFKQDKNFTFADMKIDLRVSVTAHDYESAYEQAEAEATPVDLPIGVAFVEAQCYDHEWCSDRVVGE